MLAILVDRLEPGDGGFLGEGEAEVVLRHAATNRDPETEVGLDDVEDRGGIKAEQALEIMAVRSAAGELLSETES